MADSKITGLTADTTPTGTDLIVTVDDVAGTPTNKKVTLDNLAASVPFSSRYTGLPVFKQTWYKHSSNITTTSTTFVDVDATNFPALSLTLAVNDVVELIFAPNAVKQSGVGGVMGFDWLIDRPTSADTSIRAIMGSDAAAWRMATAFDTNMTAFIARATFICTEAGVHSFKPQWKVTGGTGELVMSDANYDAPCLHRVMNMGPAS
jgi:hypothetical protein